MGHAVDADLAFAGACGDDAATGAHAEGVDAARICALPHIGGQFVVGGRQPGGFGPLAILDAVDERLRVLHAEADREGLGDHGQAIVGQLQVEVASRVAKREDHMGSVDAFAVVENDAGHATILLREPFDPCLEADLATAGDESCAERLEQRDKFVGAEVGTAFDKDIGVGTEGDEGLEHTAREVAPLARVELSVAPGACAAFSEAEVGFGVDDAVAHEARDIFGARLDRLSAVEQDGPEASLGEDERGEDATGTGANDDGPRCVWSNLPALALGASPNPLRLGGICGGEEVGRDVAVHRVHEAGRPLAPRIDGAPNNADIEVGVVAETESHERSSTHNRLGLSDLALDGGEAPGLSGRAHG